MTFDLYAWKSPRDLDAGGAAALVQRWHDEGVIRGKPFEPSEDVGWFHRELMRTNRSSTWCRMRSPTPAPARSGCRPTRSRRRASLPSAWRVTRRQMP